MQDPTTQHQATHHQTMQHHTTHHQTTQVAFSCDPLGRQFLEFYSTLLVLVLRLTVCGQQSAAVFPILLQFSQQLLQPQFQVVDLCQLQQKNYNKYKHNNYEQQLQLLRKKQCNSLLIIINIFHYYYQSWNYLGEFSRFKPMDMVAQ